jgi:hypothetical protein
MVPWRQDLTVGTSQLLFLPFIKMDLDVVLVFRSAPETTPLACFTSCGIFSSLIMLL